MPDEVISIGGHYLHRNIADVTMSNLNFPSKIKSHIYVSWLHPYKEQKFVIVGSEKMVVLMMFSKRINLLSTRI
jgi:UDP-2-acetamido-3-amino-2,3-dideoxy-glucuronate N-acetyltransferase